MRGLNRKDREHRSRLTGRALGGKRLEDVHMTRPNIVGISPFFIVQDAAGALSFYRDRLGV